MNPPKRQVSRRAARAVALGACAWLMSATPALSVASDFTYNPPGQLAAGSGRGRVDETVYVPEMRFPIEVAPAYPNSQVWGVGGSQGPAGSQCDARNYAYPWSDNYCETRTWDVPLCPGGKGHQGQDIRPATCENKKYWVVSAQDGTVTEIGSYSVYVVADDGTRHRYLHMDPPSVPVKVGDRVRQGDRLGLVSNAFNGTPTTIHLHYDIFQTVAGVGPSYVPTYMSLVRSYERLLGAPAKPCDTIPAQGKTLDDENACFELLGNLQFWRVINTAGHAGRLYWTYAYTASSPGSYARWKLHLEEAGLYRVEVYLEPEYAQSKEAIYKVRHAGQVEQLRLDQSAGAGWRPLGQWRFAQGGDQHVEINDNTGEARSLERKLMADAIRLVRLDGPAPDPDMGRTPPDMGPIDPMEPLDPVDPADLGGSDMAADLGDGPRTVDPGPRTVTSSSCAALGASRSPQRAAGLSLWALALACLGAVGHRRRRRLVG